MKTRALSMLMVVSMFCFAGFADAANLTVVSEKTDLVPSETFSVDIVIDKADGIVGCTLTVAYPSDLLELSATEPASSDFFAVFYDNREGADPASIEPWQANSTSLGTVKLAGAYVDPSTGLGAYKEKQVLFTLNFAVKDGVYGPFSIKLERTMLFNPDAGWGIDKNSNGIYDGDDEKDGAPILIKANAVGTDNDFEVVLDDFEVEPLKMFKISIAGVDSDGDGIPDSVELHEDCCLDAYNPDTDGDGLWDGVEDKNANCIVDAGETNPCLWDTDGDGISDGDEDVNKNGVWDFVDSDPLNKHNELDPLNWDTDGDLAPDGMELRYGSDPFDETWGFEVICVGAHDPDACHTWAETISKALSMCKHDGTVALNYLKVIQDIFEQNGLVLGEDVLVEIKSGAVTISFPPE